MSCIVAGCDPGRSGAIFFQYGDGSRVIYDMPLLEDRNVDLDALYSLFETHAPPVIAIESLHGPDHFKIGRAVGNLEAIALAYGTLCVAARSTRARVVKIPVPTWQAWAFAGCDIEDTKKASIWAAKILLEREADSILVPPGARTPKHDRADSVCIAHYWLSTKGH